MVNDNLTTFLGGGELLYRQHIINDNLTMGGRGCYMDSIW